MSTNKLTSLNFRGTTSYLAQPLQKVGSALEGRLQVSGVTGSAVRTEAEIEDGVVAHLAAICVYFELRDAVIGTPLKEIVECFRAVHVCGIWALETLKVSYELPVAYRTLDFRKKFSFGFWFFFEALNYL